MSSIKLLKNFLVITRHKSVAAAAREIGLTAAAAGQQLQQLEHEIGVELFDRTKRSLTLNSNGRAVIEPIQEIISKYEALGSSSKTDLSGTIVLGALVSTLMGTFGKTLNELKQNYPELETITLDDMSDKYRLAGENLYMKLGFEYLEKTGPEMIGNLNSVMENCRVQIFK